MTKKRTILSLLLIASLFDIQTKSYASAQVSSPCVAEYNLMGTAVLTEKQMSTFIENNNKNLSKSRALRIARIYKQESKIEGINSDIAFAQMCLETSFLKFPGDVRASQNNFAGIGALGNGAAGLSFASEKIGVRAHIQHLKAYASTEPLKQACVDPRYDMVKKCKYAGKVKTLSDLAGKWAADPDYGKKITDIISRISSL